MKTHRRLLIGLTLMAILAVIASGCAQKAVQAQIVKSDARRDRSPDATPADLNELTAGNNTFALDLYQALRDREGNLFYSPYSVSSALAMTYAGARGETERQMAETLHYTLPQARLHPAFNVLNLALTDRDQEDFTLHIANALWGQSGYDFLADFLDTLAQNYGAGLRLLDFASEPEPSRQVINDWVSEQTEQRIENLIPQGGITPDTRLVLANAIYFDADWRHPFDPDRTQEGAFTTLDGKEINVPMMSLGEPVSLRYVQGEGYQAVELPYEGSEMSMLLLVPDAGQFDAFEAALDASRLETILGALAPRQVDLKMPKFEYESEFKLADTLADMGMPDAFGAGADFSGMDGSRNLVISDVYHKAFVAVDEAGTEAAAATAVVMAETALPMADVELTVDRPFVFAIRDGESGAVLFLGRVVDPSG